MTYANASTTIADFARHWWIPLLRGVLAILFGLVALLMPGLTLAFLLGALAAFLIVDGILSIVIGFRRRGAEPNWWVWPLEGLLSIALAVMAFAWPAATALAFVFWIGAWSVLSGIMRIVAAVALRREIEGEWALGLSGVLSILLGVLMFVLPGAGLLSIAWMIGILSIMVGGALIAFAFRLRRLA